MEIVQIVNTVFSSNTYVLREEGMDWCWLVDVGDVDPVLECIGGDVTIRGVFLTHAHYDHLYGIMRGVHVGGGSGRNLFGQVEFFEIS